MSIRIFSILLLISSQQVFSKGGDHYLSLGAGAASMTSSLTYFDDVDGAAMSLTYGVKTSDSFAWEFTGRQTTFDQANISYTTLSFDINSLSFTESVATFSHEIEATFLGIGFRWFFWKFLNLHMGLGYSSITYNFIDGSNSTALTTTGDDTGAGFYYGAGLQLPLGWLHIYVDYTLNAFSGDIGSSETLGGFRFMF